MTSTRLGYPWTEKLIAPRIEIRRRATFEAEVLSIDEVMASATYKRSPMTEEKGWSSSATCVVSWAILSYDIEGIDSGLSLSQDKDVSGL